MAHHRNPSRLPGLSFLVLVLILVLFGQYYPVMPAAAGESAPDQTRLTELERNFQASVLRGWRYFQTSFARDGMACVNCHLKHEGMRPWAGAYPKVEVFDGTPYQVKGLRQVVLEALEKHSDLGAGKRMALVEDLVAYIAWWGDGQAITPGRSRAFPPPAADLELLKSAVARGRGLFQQQELGPCTQCHVPGEMAASRDKVPLGRAAATFPRYVDAAAQVMSLEAFLSWHLALHGQKGNPPDSVRVTDIATYLASLAQGKHLGAGHRRSEGHE